MSEHRHTVEIVGTQEHPEIRFTCHRGRDAGCHMYPDCDCESWSADHEHPFAPHDKCWMQDWFDNDCIAPSSDCIEHPHVIDDLDYKVGMSGPIEAEFQDDYVQWWFAQVGVDQIEVSQ